MGAYAFAELSTESPIGPTKQATTAGNNTPLIPKVQVQRPSLANIKRTGAMDASMIDSVTSSTEEMTSSTHSSA